MFKEDFKYYKSKCPQPDLSNVIHVGDENVNVRILKQSMLNVETKPLIGLKPINEWKIYEFVNKIGLILIRNPFTCIGQKYWIVRCLRDYPNPPNRNNLPEQIYKEYNFDTAKSWWDILNNCTKNTNRKIKLKKSLRWTTLGYQHEWNTKVYSENLKSPFPDDLATMIDFIANTLNYKNFKSEAAIVNYYPIGSSLAPHTDHSEANLHAPLFSLSFGCPAVFLVGGETIEEKPLAIQLKSGDILVMSGASRLSYHAVPKILPTDSKPWLQSAEKLIIGNKEINFEPYEEYLNDCRININIRQVLNAGQVALDVN